MGSASEMVDLIKTIIRDEENKRDRIITATVLTRNDADDTYDVYIDSEIGVNGQQTLMTSVPNESKHIYGPGDHVYVMKVRGQMAQGFIIGSIGNAGVSINARVRDLGKRIDDLSDSLIPAKGLVTPRVSFERFAYDTTTGEDVPVQAFGIRMFWTGSVIPMDSFLIHTNLKVNDVDFPAGYIVVSTKPSTPIVPTDDNRFVVSAAVQVFQDSSPLTVTVVGGSICPSNARQRLDIAFTGNGTPIRDEDVRIRGRFALGGSCGFVNMDADYNFLV